MKTLVLAMAAAALCGQDYEKLLGEAKITLVDAIDRSVQEVGGGVAVGACLEKEDGKAAFEVTLAKDDRKVEVLLAAADGSFMSKSEEKKDHSALVAKFSATLRQMILTAVQRTGGKAVGAEFHGKATPDATVETWADGKLTRVTLDVSGAIVKVEEIKPPGFLGIQAENVEGGVRVSALVTHSPAELAGLHKGDLITSVDGCEIRRLEQLIELCCKRGAGAVVAVDYVRDGQAAKLNVTLGARPAGHGDHEDDDDEEDDD